MADDITVTPIPIEGEWPYLGTREQVQAARLVCEGLLEKGYQKRSREYKSAFMKLVSLLRSKRGEHRPPSQIRGQQIVRLRKTAERAERAKTAFERLTDRTDVSALMQAIVDLMTEYGPGILAERLKAGDYRAFRDCAGLVDKLLARQEAREPRKKAPARAVSVREWPSEGSKA